MKLLIVTGLSNSAWKNVVDAMQLSMPCVSEQMVAELKAIIASPEQSGINNKLTKLLESLGDKSHYVILPNANVALNKLLNASSIRALIFYADPESSLAHALNQTPFNNEQCIEYGQKWQSELHAAYAVYREHQKSCMLVNSHDALNKRSDAQIAISQFCSAETKLSDVKIALPKDALLAAKLALQDQDELFDYYDEVRSDAPYWGEFSVSGISDPAEIASLAIESAKQHKENLHNQATNHNTRVAELNAAQENSTKELASAKSQLQEAITKHDATQTALATSQSKIKELSEQVNKAEGDAKGLNEQLQAMTAQRDAHKQELEVLNKQIQELTNQRESELSKNTELQTKLDEVNAKHSQQTEQAAKLKQELEASQASVQQRSKERDEQVSKNTELQSKLDEVNAKQTQLTEESTKLKQEFEASKNKVQQQAEQLNKASEASAALTEQVQTLTAQHKAKVQELDGLKKQLQELSSQRDSELSKNQALQSELDELSAKHKQQNQDFSQAKQALENNRAESDLQVLKISQLQDELESTHNQLVASKSHADKISAELSQLKQQAAKHDKDASNKLTALQSELNQAQSEVELLVLQVAQLQEELENTIKQTAGDAKTITQLKAELSEQTAKLEAANAEHQQKQSALNEQLSKLAESHAQTKSAQNDQEQTKQLTTALQQSQAEGELLVLQVAQLQEELETLYTEQQVRQQDKAEQSLSAEAQALNQTNQTLAAENELAILQISQLQEELEHYYQKLQEKEANPMQHILSGDKPSQRALEKGFCQHAEVLSGYAEKGYQDVLLKLHNVALADGRKFDAIEVKLVNEADRIGVEFRPTNNEQLLQWRDEFSDEHGHFITYFPQPSEQRMQRQQSTDESLKASDRLLVLSVASMIAEALQSDSLVLVKELQDTELRDWRIHALELKNQITNLPVWLSFDQLSLVEEMRTDNYEHLWLKFAPLLLNDQYFPEFEVKFAATKLSDDQLFTSQLLIELRESAAGAAPLQAWPPAMHDDYGHKFQAFVDLQSDNLEVLVADRISKNDKQLLRHLIKNLSNFIAQLSNDGTTFERSEVEWLAVAHKVQTVGDVVEGINEQVDAPSANKAFTFAEYVDLGGYQHVVFEHELSAETTLKLKVRADNADDEPDLAVVSIELRTGDNSVPFSQSEYFAEDDYGPRTLIALSEVDNLLYGEQSNPEQSNLLQEFLNGLHERLVSTDELNQQALAKWQHWLSKE